MEVASVYTDTKDPSPPLLQFVLLFDLTILGALANEAVFENFSERGLNVFQGLTLEGQANPGLESWAPWSGNPGLDFAWAIAVALSCRAGPSCSSF